ncbi:MAG: glycerophosphoryl diester phosphodiesterase [Acidimicrobiaceae bacterium]|jgi:glycerophosphoryl diester phosphodiesterase
MIILQTSIIAHRGASAAYAENTLDAFRAAGPLGAEWVELDVRRTAEGALAVHHDAHLPDGRAIVELRAADLPAAVPSLAEALEACRPLGVNVEIKNSSHDVDFDATAALVEPVVAAIEECSQPIIVSSFDVPTLARVRAVGPNIGCALLTFDLRDPQRTIDAVVAAGHVALHPWDGTVTSELVELVHDAGLKLNVWTVDDPARILELAEMGVDGIVTNVPDVAASVLRR